MSSAKWWGSRYRTGQPSHPRCHLTPPHGVIERRWARLEPLDAEKHAASIYRGVRMDPPLKRTVAATEAMYVMLSPYASSPSAPNPIDTDLLGRLLRSVMPFDERLYFAVV